MEYTLFLKDSTVFMLMCLWLWQRRRKDFVEILLFFFPSLHHKINTEGVLAPSSLGLLYLWRVKVKTPKKEISKSLKFLWENTGTPYICQRIMVSTVRMLKAVRCLRSWLHLFCMWSWHKVLGAGRRKFWEPNQGKVSDAWAKVRMMRLFMWSSWGFLAWCLKQWNKQMLFISK